MKLVKSLMLFAVAATTFTACQKEESTVAPSKTLKMRITAVSADSRTEFIEPNGTTHPTRWIDGDQVKFALNLTNDNICTSEATSNDDGVTADFDVSFSTVESETYTVCGISPASASVAFSSSYSSATIEIPSSQTPLDLSCDTKAQVIVGNATYTEIPTQVNMFFKHITAYGLLSLKNFNATGTVSSISLSSSQDLTGRYYYYPADHSISTGSPTSTSITLQTAKTENVWFACVPADWSNTTLKVVVTMTDGSTYTAEKSFPENRVMKSGKIAQFSVDMSDAVYTAPVQYVLATNPYNLAVGDQLIVAAVESDVALSTSSGNFRDETTISRSDDGKYITSPGDAVEIFEVEQTDPTNFVFKATKTVGYLYNSATSNNYVKTETTLSKGYWSLDINASGVATLKNTSGGSSRNWLRHNATSTRFACYSSGQKDIALYVLSGGNTPTPAFLVAAENTEVEAAVEEASFTVKGNVAWTATVMGGATFENGANSMTGEGPANVTIAFGANTVASTKEYVVTVTTEAEVATKSHTITFTQAAYNANAKYYKLATASQIVAGAKVLIVANNGTDNLAMLSPTAHNEAAGSTNSYAYLTAATVTVADNQIESNSTTDGYAYTVETATDGFYLKGSDGNYIYQKGTTYKSFNWSADIPTSGGEWIFEGTEDGMLITNKDYSSWMQYSIGYTSFGTYTSTQNNSALPSVYVLEE